MAPAWLPTFSAASFPEEVRYALNIVILSNGRYLDDYLLEVLNSPGVKRPGSPSSSSFVLV